MSNQCFFDGQGVYYEDESDGKVYVLSPSIMRELTLYRYATKEDVLVTLYNTENALKDTIGGLEDKYIKSLEQVHSLESKVNRLQDEVKRLQDIIVSYNIQSDNVELAGFFDELDIS